MTSPVVTRFAPSPTGHLHIGGARTALFCWALASGAKRAGREGRFLLRIEDTDQNRSSDAATRGILESLAWLGIDWDEGPVHTFQGRRIGGDPRGVGPFEQSNRLPIYDRVCQQLIELGKAYPAFDKPEELDKARKAALAQKRTYRYQRPELSPAELAQRVDRMRRGEPCVVRFVVPEQDVHVTDEVLGPVRFAEGEVEDFVLRKADGFPTYHFAVVVDDQAMGVTHILRGQEHLANTPKHVALQQALGYRTPSYAHLPLIMNADGSKMSKRDKDKAVREAAKQRALAASPLPRVDSGEFVAWLGDSKKQMELDTLVELASHLHVALPEINVEDFRASGYQPQTLCNYLALLGWSPGHDLEKFDNAFLADHFALARIGKTSARFDRVKLLAFSSDTFTAMTPERFQALWMDWAAAYEPSLTRELSDHQWTTLAAAIQPRCKTFRDAADQASYILLDDQRIPYDDKAVDKVLRKGDPPGLALLAEFSPALETVASFEPHEINEAVKAFCAARNLGMGKLAQPLRVAITGTTVSPPIDATIAALGKERTLARIAAALRIPAMTIA